jgi:hypothetical protein
MYLARCAWTTAVDVYKEIRNDENRTLRDGGKGEAADNADAFLQLAAQLNRLKTKPCIITGPHLFARTCKGPNTKTDNRFRFHY